ncbi:MAG: transcription-repair coupling factor [Vicinamibacterales bacterium]|nr:transcription-repair coupling factor [Vicinamibacterales bacterium]
MATTASLTLSALFKAAITRAGFARLSARTAGLTPSAKALALAHAASAFSGVTVAIVPTDRDVDQMAADAQFFLDALEGGHAGLSTVGVRPFPSHQVDPYRGMTPHFRVMSARGRALHAVADRRVRLVVASAAALLPQVSRPERLRQAAVAVRSGSTIEPQDLAERLIDAGFTREDPVDAHGEFTVRGGIVDIFPADDAQPTRLEFVGDMVESLRRFDPDTQRSGDAVDQLVVSPVRERFDDEGVSFFQFLAEAGSYQLFVSEPSEVVDVTGRTWEQARRSFETLREAATSAPVRPPEALLAVEGDVLPQLAGASSLDELAMDEGAHHVACQPSIEYRGRVVEWVTELRKGRERGDTQLFLAETAGMAERVVEILREYDLLAQPVDDPAGTRTAAVLVGVGALSKGFRLPDAGLSVVAERDVFEETRRAADRPRNLARTFLSDLRDLKKGDLVVHVDHGIGEFVELKQLGLGGPAGSVQEFLELRYANDDKLFVPVERLDLIQKYTGGTRPALDRLGGTTWEKAKTRVKKAMRDMAEELLKLYAQRKAVAGHAFAADSHWQQEFEDAFPYDLTPDQASAVTDIKRDMESAMPMDRLLCGDVGYGKTEVAMRAAFKAVMDGKQVAVLAPTTILAFQHLKTFRERFAGFPVTMDLVNRFRTRQEQQASLESLAAGKLDVIIGTHRLLSKDVQFKDLGLLIVDEEQRFGVAHKERIKQMKKRVDVLTMTATPIPRTLNMSLVGIRDMSVIETPPKDRLSIQTNVVKFDSAVIERAVKNEIARGGQVYFVHNRVESIFSIGNLLQRLVPDARIVVGHGQMGEHELERAMLAFVQKEADILLATTIVENGLDIPNANTIIINRADRYGLSQLYQLRGRVGRSDRPAYAYLLIPPEESLTPVARKRLAAIREFSDLGSGFRVAALDLEIRGAGNLLGGEQSGQIDSVGFEMYMKLLDETIKELKGEDIEDDARATVNLGVDLKIEPSYVAETNQRLTVYRRVAAARTEAELDTVLQDVRDRYGPFPASLLNLAEYGRVRVFADRLGIESIDREGRTVVLRFRPTAKIDPARLVKIVSEWPGATLVPPVSLKLNLDPPSRPASPAASAGRPGAGGPPSPLGASAGQAPSGRSGPWEGRLAGLQAAKRAGARPSEPGKSAGWWTARANAGTVEPGFTKAEILRKPEEDPRAEGGMFERLGGLLRALS